MKKIKLSVECWLLQGAAEDVLLLEVRAKPGKHPNFFQPVTGGIETGETPEEACLREIFEETGVKLASTRLTKISDSFEVVIGDALTIKKTLFIGRIEEVPITINPEEHVAHKSVHQKDVLNSLYWPSNKEAWALVKASLANG